jgi:hypothetical protein
MKNWRYFCLKSGALLTIILISAFVFGLSGEVFGRSPDAIAMRIVANPNRYSALRWYNENLKIKGSPQLLTVDGYPSVRDGRTVYVGGSNVSTSTGRLYTNIFIISYNQEAEKATQDIFGQILANWRFNVNLETTAGVCSEKITLACLNDDECLGTGFCTSFKAETVRDTIRMARLTDISTLLEAYRRSKNKYPTMPAGSYLPDKSLSTWPSWQETLSKLLGEGGLPIDPINKLADCPGFDAASCWNQTTRNFAWVTDINASRIPLNNYVFLYSAPSSGASYDLCTYSETGLVEAPLSCNAACVPFCFGRDCGSNGCGGSCGACSAGETCANNTCVADCATLPNCRVSLPYGITTSGYCAPSTGSCYECISNYNWSGSACVLSGAPCAATPGCLPAAPANSAELAASCGSGLRCYTCDINYSWDGSDCAADCASPNFCRSSSPANASPVTGYCLSGSCFACTGGRSWDGTNCVLITTCPNGTCDAGETCSNCLADCGVCPSTCTDSDNDGYGTAGSSGCPQSGTDCSDGNAAVNPGAVEICGNGVDEDCSGGDLVCSTICTDSDSDGYGTAGSSLCPRSGIDCNDGNAAINPGALTCTIGANNNCNAINDCAEAGCAGNSGCVPPATCTDSDSDGYGTAGSSGCPQSGIDCNDGNAGINPGATEICGNGIDEDCSGADQACAQTCTTPPGCRPLGFANAISLGVYNCTGGLECFVCNGSFFWNSATNTCDSSGPACSTPPNCQPTGSLSNASTVSGNCPSGQSCYSCNTNYTWNSTICQLNCSATPSVPGCRSSGSVSNAITVLAYCPSGESCYNCQTGFVWNAAQSDCVPAANNCTFPATLPCTFQ